MSAAIKVWDPYRNRETTFSEFAKAEGCKRMAAYLYRRRHGTLDGFRDRPLSGNGIKPHTYTYRGKYITIRDAAKYGVQHVRMQEFKRQGIFDVEKMAEILDERKERKKILRRTDDGRMMTAADFAREKGVTANTVYTYIHNHGSLAGFDSRQVSRVTIDTPMVDPLTGKRTAVAKIAKQYGCDIDTVRCYFRRHGTLKGIKAHLRGMACHGFEVEYRGEKKKFIEWAGVFGVTDASLRKYYKRHGTLDGFENRKKSRGRKAKLVKFRGEKHTLAEWGHLLGSYYQMVRNYYLSRGTLRGFENRKRNRRRRQ